MKNKVLDTAAHTLGNAFRLAAAVGTGLTDGDTTMGYQGADYAILRAKVAGYNLKNKLTKAA